MVERVLGAATDSKGGRATHGLAGGTKSAGGARMMGDEGDVCALCLYLCAATPFRDMVAGGCVGVAARAAVAGGVATLYCALRTLCKLSITLCKLFSPAWYLMLTMALRHIILYDLHFYAL